MAKRCEDPTHVPFGRTPEGRCRQCMSIGQKAYYRRLRDAYKYVQNQDSLRSQMSF